MAQGVRFSTYVQPYQSYTKTQGAITLDEHTIPSDSETGYKQLDDIHSYGKTKFIEFDVAQPYNNASMSPQNLVNIENIDATTTTLLENLTMSLGDRMIVTSTPEALVVDSTGFDIEAIYVKHHGWETSALGMEKVQVSVNSGTRWDIELNSELGHDNLGTGQAFFSRLYGTAEGQVYVRVQTPGKYALIEYCLFKRSD